MLGKCFQAQGGILGCPGVQNFLGDPAVDGTGKWEQIAGIESFRMDPAAAGDEPGMSFPIPAAPVDVSS